MKKEKRNVKGYLITTIAATIALMGATWGMGAMKLPEVEAATQPKETIDLRIIGTTDLHGQLNSKDYELGVDYSNGGLARVFDLIKKTRDELPKENTVTVDAGDVLYDYTTEYIFSESQNEIQPIYKAMAKIGYDAITLGNHDFDYGYEYIQKQLNGAGLRDITVVSNVTDSKTGEYPFLENMLIVRKVKTSTGREIEVKIGIIGQTIPVFTAKTHSYAGILKGEDMVINAQIQATKLKEMGADIIIALSHTGIGPVEPELNFKNVAYALTKIDEIDVVVCGHEHNLFPTTDMTSPYYKLPNVDKKTYLMNGKNVIMAGNRGSAIGVVDLTLNVYGDTLRIAERSSEIRFITANNTTEDKAIANSYGIWEDKLSDYHTDIIATLEKGGIIQNYYGLLGDNPAIQLLNDSKIDYALRFVNTTGKKYSGYPILAASTYASFGAGSIDEFINIHDSITESGLSAIQPYNNYIYIYTITGKQLKEWLEWTASAYETAIGNPTWSKGTMSELMLKTGLKSLIREDWLNDWTNFYIFDGIDYVIDPTTEPRYDINGNRISMSNRVSSIKYNGVPVEEDAVMLLATNKITQPNDAIRGIDKQVSLNGFIRSQVILSKYIKQINGEGSLIPQLDYNWKVSLPYENRFLVRAPYYAQSLIEETPWYGEFLSQGDDYYSYYIASYQVENDDIIGPHIVASPAITRATATPYEVGIYVADASKIKQLRYLSGEYDLNHYNWSGGVSITNNKFVVRKNGTYSIYAEDSYGNKSVYKLVIDNFSDNLLGAPTVITYTNRKSKISGRGEPKATVVFEAYTGVYESKIGADGTFSYPLPSQPSGTEVIVYIKDAARALESERVRVPVKRTGPNQPSLNPIYNDAGFISGNTGDTDASVIAVIGDKVYVSDQGGKELYEKNIEIYDVSLNIVPTSVEINELGYFIITLPPQVGGQAITVYSIDHLSRNSSPIMTTVIEVAPNAPTVYEVSNIEKSINGYVPKSSGKIYDIVMKFEDKSYFTQIDKYGKFSFQIEKQLHAGQKITVQVFDNKNGATRFSYLTEVIVNDIENYIKTTSTNLTLNRVTDKSYQITGFNLNKGLINLAIASGEGDNFQNTLLTFETNEAGKIRYTIDGKLEAGTNIYVMTRFSDGKILLANKTVVISTKPDMPILLKDVTNADKLVQIIAKKGSEVLVTIGAKTYSSSEYLQDEATGNYVYSLVTDRVVSGTVIKVTATNASGTSDQLSSVIVKAAPDQPQVSTVKAGDTVVTGKIELLDYTIPVVDTSVIDETVIDAVTTDEIPARFKDAATKVAKTQTRIFVSIGKKTYEGTINNKGKFSIKIPAQKQGVKIKVWGTNKAGRGPLLIVVIVK
ncbi:MAG: Ig-like domain-containing protein [Mobilitalea sp.]